MRLLIALSLVAALPANAEDSPSPLELARQAGSDGPLYAYDMTLETSEITATGKIDPTAPLGSRVTIYAPAKEDWPEEFANRVSEIEAEADGDIWCASMVEQVPSDAELLSNESGVARYTFKPLAEDKEDEKFMKHLTGTIDIDTADGAVLQFNMSAKKAFKPHIMVKIKSFRMSASCARAPDGRTYAEKVELKISGSAAMQSIEESNTRTITALYSAS